MSRRTEKRNKVKPDRIKAALQIRAETDEERKKE